MGVCVCVCMHVGGEGGGEVVKVEWWESLQPSLLIPYFPPCSYRNKELGN